MTILVMALFSLAIIQGVQVFHRSSSSVLGVKTNYIAQAPPVTPTPSLRPTIVPTISPGYVPCSQIQLLQRLYCSGSTPTPTPSVVTCKRDPSRGTLRESCDTQKYYFYDYVCFNGSLGTVGNGQVCYDQSKLSSLAELACGSQGTCPKNYRCTSGNVCQATSNP